MAGIFAPPTMAVIRALIAQLEALGVTIPDEVAPLLAVHDRITAPEPYKVGPQVELADLGPDDIVRWTVLRTQQDAIQDTKVHAEQLLAREVAEHLTAHADDVIDVLRPAFDQAAGYFTAAHKSGVTEHTTASDLLDAPTKAVAAWRAATAHVEALGDIARARVAMSHTLGIPPDDDGSGSAYAACFSNAGTGWTNNPDDVATWLRLAAKRLVLQHVDETASLTYRHRIPLLPGRPWEDEPETADSGSLVR